MTGAEFEAWLDEMLTPAGERAARNMTAAAEDYRRVRDRPRGVWPDGRRVTETEKLAAFGLYQQMRERLYGRPPERETVAAAALGMPGDFSFTRAILGV